MKKQYILLSTLMGMAGLLTLGSVGTKSKGKEEVKDTNNETIVLTSSDGDKDYSYVEDTDKQRVSDEFRYGVKRGDIWYTPVGEDTPLGNTGHVGIVESVWKDYRTGYYNLTVIDSNQGKGVMENTVTPEEFFGRQSRILRVPNMTTGQIDQIIADCSRQIGHDYPGTRRDGWNFFASMFKAVPDCTAKKEFDSAPSDATWYCSELVWAVYQKQGIDLDQDNTDEQIISKGYCNVSPMEIFNSPNTETIIEYDNKHAKMKYDIETLSTEFYKYVKKGDYYANFVGVIFKDSQSSAPKKCIGKIVDITYSKEENGYVLKICDSSSRNYNNEFTISAREFYYSNSYVLRKQNGEWSAIVKYSNRIEKVWSSGKETHTYYYERGEELVEKHDFEYHSWGGKTCKTCGVYFGGCN